MPSAIRITPKIITHTPIGLSKYFNGNPIIKVAIKPRITKTVGNGLSLLTLKFAEYLANSIHYLSLSCYVSNSNVIILVMLYRLNTITVFNNDGILVFEHKSRFFVTLWDADSSIGNFSYVVIFFVELVSLPFTNMGKKECSGKNQPRNLCETNARGKYGETIHHLEAIYKTRKKKFLRLWGKYIQEKTGKKETPITAWGDFCPPSKISFLYLKENASFSRFSQGYFSTSYLFPSFSLSQNTHTFPIFSPNADCVLNQVFVLKPLSYFHRENTIISKIRRLRGILANAPTVQTCIWGRAV